MLEKMGEFFENRIEGYDSHMLNGIEFAKEFYPFTAECLPKMKNAKILDLGCGTGLELEEYFSLNPTAQITGIDLSEKMLDVLKAKFPDKSITFIKGSYFDILLEDKAFHAAVSVESLHHFTKEEKIPLYTKLKNSLKDGGYFILTDYFSLSDEEEQLHRKEYLILKEAENIKDNELYHFDTPLTVEHEAEALKEAGFSSIEILKRWGATVSLKAGK